MLQANILRCYVETDSIADLIAVKKAINMYFGQVVRILNRMGVEWGNPEATIMVGEMSFYGTVETRARRIKAVLDE